MWKNKECTCKACKIIVFCSQICKFVTFSLPSSLWLLKLPCNQPNHLETAFSWMLKWIENVWDLLNILVPNSKFFSWKNLCKSAFQNELLFRSVICKIKYIYVYRTWVVLWLSSNQSIKLDWVITCTFKYIFQYSSM